MTRLEPAGEPSMEDILASIRKIIAEDPPGSRALPEVRAEPAAPSVTDRIFQRLGDATRSEPAKPAVAAEPYLRSAMPTLSSAPAQATSAGKQEPFDIDAQMAEVLSKTRGLAPRRDIEPSFDRAVPDVQAALDSLPVAPSLGAISQTPAQPQPRPGFTVARDGFVPEAPANAATSDPFEFSLGPSPFAARTSAAPAIETAMPEVRDTRFQDFGTFVPTRPMMDDAAPVATQEAAHGSVKANDAISTVEASATEQEPVTHAAETAEAKPADAGGSGSPSPEAIAAQLKDFETAINAPASEPLAALESVETVLAELKTKLDKAAASDVETGASAAAPEPELESKAATEISPAAAEAANIEDALAAGQAAAPVSDTAPGAAAAKIADVEPAIETPVEDIVDIVAPVAIAAPELDREVTRETAQELVVADAARAAPDAEASSPFHSMQMSQMQNAGVPGARSMEDTVAELLRPMLRSWLAENMPKIVERALRKEIDGSLHSEHKTAAE